MRRAFSGAVWYLPSIAAMGSTWVTWEARFLRARCWVRASRALELRKEEYAPLRYLWALRRPWAEEVDGRSSAIFARDVLVAVPGVCADRGRS